MYGPMNVKSYGLSASMTTVVAFNLNAYMWTFASCPEIC
jgi:hypothetical protein